MRSSKMSLNSKKIKLSFHVQYMPQLQGYHTENPINSKHTVPEITISDAQNNKIKIKLNAIIGCISKSIIASSDSFGLITSIT